MGRFEVRNSEAEQYKFRLRVGAVALLVLLLFCILLFRLFDIWKPFPIRQFDARLKGGFGVMFDDLLAALYAIAALKALQWLMLHS